MEKVFRKTGIDIIGDAPWGTHLCQFYETREDLVDILVPYFKAGLENNEFCMWITSEPLKVEDAKAALKKVVKNLDHFIKKGQIEILDYSEWYTKSGKFDANNVLQGWVEKENQALKRGYDGLRLSGNTFWLAKRDWRNFTDYEEEVNNVVSKYRMIAICTYSLGQCGASEVIDVISNHQFALIRREGKWVIIESSERKQAEEMLRESEEHYRQLFEAESDAIVLIDNATGCILEANSAAAALYGYSKEELLSKKNSDLSAEPEETQRVTQTTPVDVNRVVTVPLRFHRKQDGSVFPVKITGRFLIRQGRSVHIAAIRDITERKRAEESLRRAEENFRRSLDESPLGVRIVSANGETLYANRAILDIYGYDSIEELRTTPTKKLYTPESYAEFQKRLEKRRRGEDTPSGYEISIVRKSGEVRHLQVFRKEVLWNGERQFQTIYQDITERKRAEVVLRRSEERFRTSVETLLEGFAILSAVRDSNGQLIDFRYEYINEIGCKMNQKAREEHIGRTLLKLFPEEKEIGLFDDYVEVIETGQPLVKEHVIYEPVYGGSDRLKQAFDVRISRLEDGIVVTWQDITERKKREELLRQSEERLKRLVENSKNIIVMADLEGEVLYYNGPPGYGVRTEDVLGKNAFSIFEPVIAARLMNQLRRVVKEKEALTIENFISRRGESFWFLTHIYPIKDEKDHMIAVGIIAMDITEHKRIEEEYRTILRTTMDGFWIVDMQGHFLDVNDAYCRLIGYSRDELLTMRIPDIETVETPEETAHRIQKIKKTGGDRFETHHRCKDGRIMDVEISVNYIDAGGGRLFVFVRDITEHRRAEKEIQSLAKFPSENPNPILRIARDGMLLYMNEAGLSLLPEWHLQVGQAINHPMLGEVAFRAMDNGSTQVLDLEHGERVYSFFVGPVVDAGYANLYGRDITERKQAEDALHESEGKYRNLVESISDVVYAIDSSGVLTYISPVVKNTLGYEPDELIGRQFLEFVHKEDHDLLMRRFSELREGIARHSDYRVIGKHGDIKWVRTLTNPIIEEGGLVGARGVLIDITERKRAEEALRVALTKYETFFDSFPLGITVSDKAGKIIEVNRQSEQLLGITREEHAQRRINSKEWQIIRKDGTPMPADEYASTRALRENRLIGNVEMGIVKDKGEITWISVTAAPIPLEGYGVAIAYSDITERKQAEEELKRLLEQLHALSAHLQSIREEERTLIAREIHDELGQALTIVKMDLSWLVKRLRKDQKSLIDKNQSMLKLIDSTIQTVRKISTDLRPGILDDLGLVAAIEWQAQDFENRSGISCDFISSLEEIDLDRDRSTAVFRILQEILTNVTRHAKATHVGISLVEEANHLVLTVGDNGLGIRERDISNPRSLGLLGMRERALMFSGELKISGVHRKGTTVTVTIPLKQSEKVKSKM